jgi:hypothetical protein
MKKLLAILPVVFFANQASAKTYCYIKGSSSLLRYRSLTIKK